MWDAEYAEFVRDRFGVRSRRDVLDESDNLLLRSYERLDVCLAWVWCSPYADVGDKMWVYMCKVFVFHVFRREQFRGSFEVQYHWLEFPYYARDRLCMAEVVVEVDA
jgi:hypothetical protein